MASACSCTCASDLKNTREEGEELHEKGWKSFMNMLEEIERK